MTPLLEHTVPEAPKCRFLSQKIKITNHFLNLTCSDLGKLCQKLPKFDFQRKFSMSKVSLRILIFSAKIIKAGVQVGNLYFLMTTVYFIKMGLIIVDS